MEAACRHARRPPRELGDEGLGMAYAIQGRTRLRCDAEASLAHPAEEVALDRVVVRIEMYLAKQADALPLVFGFGYLFERGGCGERVRAHHREEAAGAHSFKAAIGYAALRPGCVALYVGVPPVPGRGALGSGCIVAGAPPLSST